MGQLNWKGILFLCTPGCHWRKLFFLYCFIHFVIFPSSFLHLFIYKSSSTHLYFINLIGLLQKCLHVFIFVNQVIHYFIWFLFTLFNLILHQPIVSARYSLFVPMRRKTTINQSINSLLLGYIFICIWKCKILWQKILHFMKSVVKNYDNGTY